MSGAEWAILAGTFLGGAIPWLEVVIVIPAGIVAGGNPVLVLIAGLAGNLLTVWIAAYFGAQIRDWWIRRRARTRAAEQPERRQKRIDKIMGKWGMPGLAILGPLGVGTQLSALAAVALGVRARTAFLWVGAATTVWAIAATVLAMLGVSALGIGA